MRVARRMFWRMYGGGLVVTFVVFVVLLWYSERTDSPALHEASGYPFAVWLLVGWWFTNRVLLPLLIRSIRCPHCGEEYECVAQWRCSCGYQDHRERHLLRFKCPMCKKRLGWTECLRCRTTILIR